MHHDLYLNMLKYDYKLSVQPNGDSSSPREWENDVHICKYV